MLLLDEPTASLDARNRAVVVDLIAEKKRRGAAIVGIFHDDEVRDAIADVVVDVTRLASRAALKPCRPDHRRLRPFRQCPHRPRRPRRSSPAGSPSTGGTIVEIGEGARARNAARTCGGDYLMPGLVELHTDHLEAHVRAAARGALGHAGRRGRLRRARSPTCGITTVLDSLRVWREEGTEDVDGEAEHARRRHRRCARRPACCASITSCICAAKCRCRTWSAKPRA